MVAGPWSFGLLCLPKKFRDVYPESFCERRQSLDTRVSFSSLQLGHVGAAKVCTFGQSRLRQPQPETGAEDRCPHLLLEFVGIHGGGQAISGAENRHNQDQPVAENGLPKS